MFESDRAERESYVVAVEPHTIGPPAIFVTGRDSDGARVTVIIRTATDEEAYRQAGLINELLESERQCAR